MPLCTCLLTFPSSITMILSESMTAFKRCAIVSIVHSLNAFLIVSCILASKIDYYIAHTIKYTSEDLVSKSIQGILEYL